MRFGSFKHIGKLVLLGKSHQVDPEKLLRRARDGEATAVGELLKLYRPCLSLLARLKVDRQLRQKLDDSDLVQDTCLSAHRDFDRFKGTTEKQFTSWLREIMANVAANHARDHRRQKRDVRQERQLYDLLSQSSQMIERALATTDSSPSIRAERRERAVLLATALNELSADYREVLVLRELEGKSLIEVAEQLNRTPNATQKLWARAVLQLRRHMQTSFEM